MRAADRSRDGRRVLSDDRRVKVVIRVGFKCAFEEQLVRPDLVVVPVPPANVQHLFDDVIAKTFPKKFTRRVDVVLHISEGRLPLLRRKISSVNLWCHRS
jgi:hypothetical protein